MEGDTSLSDIQAHALDVLEVLHTGPSHQPFEKLLHIVQDFRYSGTTTVVDKLAFIAMFNGYERLSIDAMVSHTCMYVPLEKP